MYPLARPQSIRWRDLNISVGGSFNLSVGILSIYTLAFSQYNRWRAINLSVGVLSM